MQFLTLETFANTRFNVLTIFLLLTKLYFGLSERYGFILDQCATVGLSMNERAGLQALHVAKDYIAHAMNRKS